MTTCPAYRHLFWLSFGYLGTIPKTAGLKSRLLATGTHNIEKYLETPNLPTMSIVFLNVPYPCHSLNQNLSNVGNLGAAPPVLPWQPQASSQLAHPTRQIASSKGAPSRDTVEYPT